MKATSRRRRRAHRPEERPRARQRLDGGFELNASRSRAGWTCTRTRTDDRPGQALGAVQGRRDRPAHRGRPRPAELCAAVGAETRFGAAHPRRCRRDRAEPREPARRHPMERQTRRSATESRGRSRPWPRSARPSPASPRGSASSSSATSARARSTKTNINDRGQQRSRICAQTTKSIRK